MVPLQRESGRRVLLIRRQSVLDIRFPFALAGRRRHGAVQEIDHLQHVAGREPAVAVDVPERRNALAVHGQHRQLARPGGVDLVDQRQCVQGGHAGFVGHVGVQNGILPRPVAPGRGASFHEDTVGHQVVVAPHAVDRPQFDAVCENPGTAFSVGQMQHQVRRWILGRGAEPVVGIRLGSGFEQPSQCCRTARRQADEFKFEEPVRERHAGRRDRPGGNADRTDVAELQPLGRHQRDKLLADHAAHGRDVLLCTVGNSVLVAVARVWRRVLLQVRNAVAVGIDRTDRDGRCAEGDVVCRNGAIDVEQCDFAGRQIVGRIRLEDKTAALRSGERNAEQQPFRSVAAIHRADSARFVQQAGNVSVARTDKGEITAEFEIAGGRQPGRVVEDIDVSRIDAGVLGT